MTQLRPQDAVHKSWLIRLLIEIADDGQLSQNLRFKGGTCASMLGWLDRFSIDLDFDLAPLANESKLRARFHNIFAHLGLVIKQENQKALEFWVKYKVPADQRNTLKIDALNLRVKANQYQPQYLAEIDRMLVCQTRETMFANKLVAPLDRYATHQSIAGRDIYDIHHFYWQGYTYDPAVIEERAGQSVANYLQRLVKFIRNYVTQTLVDQDLNTLLPATKFAKIRKTLVAETLVFLENDLLNYGKI